MLVAMWYHFAVQIAEHNEERNRTPFIQSFSTFPIPTEAKGLRMNALKELGSPEADSPNAHVRTVVVVMMMVMVMVMMVATRCG
eukprot:6858551-Alexandrium_andersonii.AAC.1